MGDVAALLVGALLLLGNAFFVGAEFAIIAARRTQLEPLSAAGNRFARAAVKAMRDVSLIMAGAQFGITICSLLLLTVSEPAIAHLLEGPFHAVGIPDGLIHPVAFVIALTLMTSLHMAVGEMVPKNIALATPERAAMVLAMPMLWFVTVTRPVLLTLNAAANGLLRPFGIRRVDEVKTVYTAEELAGLVAESRTEGLLDPEAHARITGALALHRWTAADVLRPWSGVDTVPDDVTPGSLEVLATRTRRSRFPVVERGTRRVLGFVHVKDVLAVNGSARRRPVSRDLVRPLAVVSAERTLADLMLYMRRSRSHIVLVSDEAKRPLGIVTMADVLAAVVGGRRPRVAASPR